MNKITTFWNILHSSFEKNLKDKGRGLEKRAVTIQYLLHFLGQSIEYQGGKKVIELEKIISLVIEIIDEDFDVEVMMTLSKIGALLLVSKKFMMGQLEASRLSKKILHINHAFVFESFVVNLIGYSQFDVLILPDFLKYYERNPSKSSLKIFAKVVSQRPSSCDLLENLGTESNYSLNLKSQSIEGIIKRVTNYDLKSDESNELEEFLMSVQILPHLKSYDKEKVEKHLLQLLKKTLTKIQSSFELKELYLLTVLISTLHHISGSINKILAVGTIDVVLLLLKEKVNVPCLIILRFLILQSDNSQLTKKLFERIHKELQRNLLSRSEFHRTTRSD